MRTFRGVGGRMGWTRWAGSAGVLLAASVAACAGDDFAAAPPEATGGGGSTTVGGGAGSTSTAAGTGGANAGTGGTSPGGSGGSSAGASGASPGGASGSAGSGAAGSAGVAGSAGNGGGAGGATGGSAGKAGKGGSAGNAGNAGNGGTTPVDPGPSVTSVALFVATCAGDRFEDATGNAEVPHGAGDRCVVVTGDFKQGDALTIAGAPIAATFDASKKAFTATWTVPHGAGTGDTKNIDVTVTRGGLSSPTSPSSVIKLVPRQLDSLSASTNELGTTKAPYRNLKAALNGATTGDWIAATTIGSTQPSAPLVVPAGVTVASKTEALVMVNPLSNIALAAGAQLLRLSLACTQAPCVSITGAEAKLGQTSVLDAPGPGLVLAEAGASVAIDGGTFRGTAPIVVSGNAAALRVKGASVTVTTGGVAGIQLQDSAGGTQTLSIEGGGAPTVFTSNEFEGWIRSSNAKQITITNVKGDKGGSLASAATYAAIDLRGAATDVKIADLTAKSSGTTMYLAVGTASIASSTIEKTGFFGVHVEGGTLTIAGLTIVEPISSGLALYKGAKLLVPGKLAVEWLATDTKGVAGGLLVDEGASATITGTAIFSHPPITGVEVRKGGSLVVEANGPGDGLRVHDAVRSAIVARSGSSVTVNRGGLTQRQSADPSLAPLLDAEAKGSATKIAFHGTTSFLGSTAIPTPAGELHQLAILNQSGGVLAGTKEITVMANGQSRPLLRFLADAAGAPGSSYLLSHDLPLAPPREAGSLPLPPLVPPSPLPPPPIPR